MKTLRLYILFLLAGFSSIAFALTLPSSPFYGASELYEENKDEIEYSIGTKIKSINILISTVNSSWGSECLSQNSEPGACLDCCTQTLLNAGTYDEQTVRLYNSCRADCGGGPSLPLGSALWLLPFAFAYGIIKRYKNKKADC